MDVQPSAQSEALIPQLAEKFLGNAKGTDCSLSVCAQVGGRTPSDFPLAGLDQTDSGSTAGWSA